MTLVTSYLKYLRDVSRKIVFRSGFDNVLPEETSRRKNFYKEAFSTTDNYSEILIENPTLSLRTDEVDFKQYLDKVEAFLDSNRRTDKPSELFIGFGIIKLNNGKTKGGKTKYLFAPLLYCIVEIDIDSDNNYQLSLDKDSFQLNIDLLARLLKWDLVGEEDDETNVTFNSSYTETLKFIDNIENEIQQTISNKKIINLKLLFNNLKQFFKIFNTIDYKSNEYFDYKNRFEEKNFFNTSDNNFYEHSFFFTKEVPNELTTYESLKRLVEQTENNKAQNQLLNKLLENALTKQRRKYDLFSEFSNYNFDDVLKYLPFSLSPRQQRALKTTWENELTYIEGPPGTGKSFTITALILSAFLLNKKVLFVSHKKPAVDIVREKIETLLGSDSIMSLGNNFKKQTKLSIERTLNEVNRNDKRSSVKNLEDDLNKLIKELNDCLDEIKYLQNEISEGLKIENSYYKVHNEFRHKRKYFETLDKVKNPLINFNDFSLVSSNSYNDKDYDRAIIKYKRIEKKYENEGVITRIDRFYQIKLLKHFKENFQADAQILSLDSNFLGEIKNLFSTHSKSEQIRLKINDFRLEQNRHRLSLRIKEKEGLIKKFLLAKFKFDILKNLTVDKLTFDSLESFKRALYWKSPERIKQNWDLVNFGKLTTTFPVWCAELRDLNGGFPFIPDHFDLIIIDESSQVNIAEIIPALYRGKRYCIVGDRNQLHLDSVGVGFALSKNFDDFCWSKNGLNREINTEDAKNDSLLVSRASLLNFIDPAKRIVHVNEVMLNEHFRSLPSLARYTSKEFYNSQWSIMTENAENIDKICFHPIHVIGNRDPEKKIIEAEVNECIQLLNNLIRDKIYLSNKLLTQFNFNNDLPSIGIISFLTDQKDVIKTKVEENFSDEEMTKHKVFVGTPEDFQGNERDIIIITLGLDGTSLQKARHSQNPNRFNVATSRAKYFTYFIYAGIPENAFRLEKYLSHFDYKPSSIFKDKLDSDETNIKERWSYDRNKCESEFELKVADFLEKFSGQYPDVKLFNQVGACGQKRLDFVLFNTSKKITCAIEVDGKDHFLEDGKNYSEEHRERIRVLETAGWKIVHIKYFNWYDKKGWLCETDDNEFKKEIEILYQNLRDQLRIV